MKVEADNSIVLLPVEQPSLASVPKRENIKSLLFTTIYVLQGKALRPFLLC